MQPGDRGVDGREVPRQDGLAALAVARDDRVLDGLHRLVDREDVGQGEEARLQHGVDAGAETGLFGDAVPVDHEEPQSLVDDLALNLDGQLVPDLVGTERAVQQERCTGSSDPQDVGSLQPFEVVTGDEARLLDQVRGSDRTWSEAQVRHGDGAGLLRVEDEIALRVQVGVRTDDLDRVAVRADRSVAAQTDEHRSDHVIGLGRERAVDGKARSRHVVHDADREVVLRLLGVQLGEDRRRHGRRELLRRKAVPAADHLRHPAVEPDASRRLFLDERRDHILVERLAGRAGFLRAVEDRDPSHRGGHRRDERLGRERPEQPDLHGADPLAARDQGLDRLLDGAATRPHEQDDALGLGMPHVVEEVVGTPGSVGDPVHHLLDDVGDRRMELVRRLARLEEDIGVLCRSSQDGMIRAERPSPVLPDEAIVDQGPEVRLLDRFDLVDLVRCAEAVEEVQERDACPERRGVGDERHVLGLLDRRRAQHREPGRSSGHHVAVIAEDRERVRRHRPCRDVHHERRQLARDLEHVGDHQEQALR